MVGNLEVIITKRVNNKIKAFVLEGGGAYLVFEIEPGIIVNVTNHLTPSKEKRNKRYVRII